MFDRNLPSLLRFPLLLATLFASLHALHADELQDPTRPSYLSPAAATPGDAGTAPSLMLTAILLSPTQRSAMINDRTVKTGDRIGDARVVSIGRNGVRLQRGTEQFTLHLLPITIKQAHKAARR